ncbi:MAG: HAMP domain-containing histidine kinase [Clostridia bacterium]|nr:HAMP domain-containing histidine kinase [Clostridia bacterium]
MSNTRLKKLFFPIIIISIIFVLIGFSTYKWILKKFKIRINSETEAMVMAIKDEYPNVDEKIIIEKIQNSKDITNSNILEKYGYSNSTVALGSAEEFSRKVCIAYALLAIMFGIVIVIYIAVYTKKRNRKIEEIINYIKDINNKVYTLKIEENSEDELSKLSNELYKITILLKETTENTKKENEGLTNALEDISHQLKTPLTSIGILLDNIEENPVMDDEIRNDFIRSINSQFNLISNLVVSILNLAKIDSGTVKMDDKEFCIMDLLSEIKEDLEILLEVKNINIQINGDIDATIIADYKWQKQAITNIVKNAIEHSNDNSNIYIKIENSSVFLKLKIIDEGEGISKQDMSHIFERFYKSKSSASGSVGIGLAFSKAVIEKNNGYVTVSSEEGKGTTFVIKYLK